MKKPLNKIQTVDLLDLNELGEWLTLMTKRDLVDLGLSDSNIIKRVRFKTGGKTSIVQVIIPQYAQFIDSGRKPGGKRPPIAVILEWITRKNIRPKRGQSLNSLAWAIATAIRDRGIRPRPFLKNIPIRTQRWVEDHLEEMASQLTSAVAQEIRKAAKRSIYFQAK